MENKKVILVDEQDNYLGFEEKIKAHQEGRLHRAFSIFIFNSKNELLLQKRSSNKYHTPGLWTNTCCSHPQPNRELIQEAQLRLRKEMGINCKLNEMFSFIYIAEFENGLIEHEFDHVFFGRYDEIPVPDSNEVSDWKWILLIELNNDIESYPKKYTPWLKICLDRVISAAKTYG